MFLFLFMFLFFFLIENLDRDQRRNLFAQEQSKKVFLFWMPSFLVVLEWWPVAVILITTLTKQFWQLLCHLFPERNTSENEDAVNAKEEAAICWQLAGINNEIKIQSQFYSISPFSSRYVPPPSTVPSLLQQESAIIIVSIIAIVIVIVILIIYFTIYINLFIYLTYFWSAITSR